MRVARVRVVGQDTTGGVCLSRLQAKLKAHTTPNHATNQPTPQIRAYGACIAAKLEGAQGVERGACEAEFSALRVCFRQQLTSKGGK